MKRSATLTIVALALGIGVLAYLGRSIIASSSSRSASVPDSVWYHASDVALLGRTDRPQLVEFFHPG